MLLERDSQMQSDLERLEFIGFTRVGSWNLVDSELTLSLNSYDQARNVLYSFVVDGRLTYIGKTADTLKRRMLGYKSPGHSQSTNIKNRQKIVDCLGQEMKVEIYALPDNGLLHYGGFHVNLAAGLEDSLIRELNPEWNGRQKEITDGTLAPITEA